MDHFEYTNNLLHAEDVALPKIAEAVGTPFYCYSTATLERHYRVLEQAFLPTKVALCYAVKANANIAVIKTLARLGAGADTVSEGEIRKAIAAGIAPEHIVFSGIGKTEEEISYALDQNVGQFNVESRDELAVINDVAKAKNKKAAIAVRINPDVDAATHDKIATGRKGDKFGIAYDDAFSCYQSARKLPHLSVVGIATHIGSQLTQLKPFELAFHKLAAMVHDLRRDGFSIERIDLGGGLGIPYSDEEPPHPEAYAKMILDIIGTLEAQIVLEPGRLIVGNAGILVTKVIRHKEAYGKHFLIVDAAMNDLIRPSMYQAHHHIVPVLQNTGQSLKPVDVVGPVCESADIFVKHYALPEMPVGSLLAIRSAGAYGAAMSSTYNSRLLVPEVLVKGSRFSVVRPRQTYEALIGQEKFPEWLK